VTLWNGDCLELMKRIPDGSIDLVVTSPPYDNLRTYNDSLEWSFEVFKPIALELTRCLAAGGVIVWNVADATIKGSETGSSFRQALYFKDECGLNLHDTMIWNKPNNVPRPSNRYEQSFEYMFILSKGKPKSVNLIKDKTNVSFGRKLSGNLASKSGRIKLHGSGKTVSQFGTRNNVWEINTQNGKHEYDHPAVFPIQLANDHILSWSNPGDTVLDPFMGSGTTGVACRNTGRSFIGIEKDATYFEIAKRRVR